MAAAAAVAARHGPSIPLLEISPTQLELNGGDRMVDPAKSTPEDDAAVMQNNKDFIRELPDELLCLIVSKLKLRDAVKTTVLSKRWIHILPSLNMFTFDRFSMFKQDGHPCAPSRTSEFLGGVTRFLDFYQPPHIQCLEFSFCLQRGPADIIDGWVRFALQQGAQALRFRFYCATYCCSEDDQLMEEEGRGAYVLGSALLNGAKSSLKELDLLGCYLELNSNFSDQFRQLRVLKLDIVTLLGHDLQTMLSCLIKLEDLALCDCVLPEKLSLTTSILLKRLRIQDTSNYLRKLEIRNANILWFHCLTGKTFASNSISFRKLRKLFCNVDDEAQQNIFASLPKRLPWLRFLLIRLGRNIQPAKLLLSKNITTFVGLKTLWLRFRKNVEFCFSILKAFPCLQKLIIESRCSCDGHPVITSPSTYEQKYLKKIVLYCCPPSKCTQLAISLLEHASSVERLFLIQNCGNCFTRSSWDEGAKRRVLEELQGRIPRNVSIVIE